MTKSKVMLNKTDVNLEETQNTSMSKWAKSLLDFPMFLVHVWKLKNGDNYTLPSYAHELLEIFSQCPTDTNWKNKFLAMMIQYREFLDRWIIHQKIDEAKVEENDLKEDTSFYYWDSNRKEVAYCAKFGEIDEASKKSLKQIQMALYALGGEQQEWLLEAFQELEKLKDYTTWRYFLREILIKKAGFRKWVKPNLNEWPTEQYRYAPNLRAPLICLDYFLWELATCTSNHDELKNKVFSWELTPAEEQAIKNYYPHKNNRSVEHFHPRTDDSIPNHEAWDDSSKHHFGNLALISPGQNSKFGNEPVPGKNQRLNDLINKQSLESIKLMLMARACNGLDANWTPDEAQKHANLMLEVIKWGVGFENTTTVASPSNADLE